MFHNYFFLKRLANDLDKVLVGKELIECFSQNKDELILGFSSQKQDFFIKATLDSQISLLHFSEDFKRAKKNSINLFPDFIHQRVSEVSVFQFERSFSIRFENDFSLIFKMHGSRANILQERDNKIIQVFRNNLAQDLQITPSELHKPQVSKSEFKNQNGDLRQALPALGKEANEFLTNEGYYDLDIDQKWKALLALLSLLESNPISIFTDPYGMAKLSLLIPTSTDPSIWQTYDALAAASQLYQTYSQKTYLEIGKQSLLKELNKQIKQSENYLSKTSENLFKVKKQRSYEEVANVIMAHLHQFQHGKLVVELDDFYTGQKLSVELKPNTTPQKHAEKLYRKAKNQRIEIAKLEENIRIRETELAALLEKKEETENLEDFKSLRQANKTAENKKEETIELPYHSYQCEGYQVLVGKNAKSNDLLTTKIATKNDLWLHARDVPGSHVIIRNQTSKTIPKTVIVFAAELAGWFSKRKTDTLCSVIYIETKFVRKIKGTPAGTVKVEKENVLMISPKNHPSK